MSWDLKRLHTRSLSCLPLGTRAHTNHELSTTGTLKLSLRFEN